MVIPNHFWWMYQISIGLKPKQHSLTRNWIWVVVARAYIKNVKLSNATRILYTFFYLERSSKIYSETTTKSTWITTWKWGGTSPIHTEEPMTCIACLASLWATKLPSWRTWEKLILWKDSAKIFPSRIKWPKEARKGVGSFNELITKLESP